MIAVEELAELFVEIADTLVAEFDLVDFLQTLTTRAADLSRSSSAGLLLADPHGELQFMAASDESTSLLELFQVQAHDGPCQDCFRHGTPVVNADLRQARDRWPHFTPAALDAGFLSVHAFPMRHAQGVIGALNLFSGDTGRLEEDERRVIQSLADVATIGLLQERAARDAEILTTQLQSALNSRIVIEQAKGVLARTHDVDVDTAFQLLRTYTRQHGHRLGDVALAVVTDPRSHPGLTTLT